MRALVIVVACGVAGGVLGALPPPRAPLVLAIDCEHGDQRACSEAQPYAARYGDYELFELDASCVVENNAYACEEVAYALHGDDDDASPAMRPLAASRLVRALEMFVPACRTGNMEACSRASRAYAAGFGVPWNELVSRIYGMRACDGGITIACEREGDRSRGVDAIQLYRRACPASPHACAKLARAEDAAGLAIAELDYRNACEYLAFDACAHVADSIDRLADEPPALVAAFERWCSDGDARACRLTATKGRR